MSDSLTNALAGEAPTIKASSPVVINPLAGISTAQEMVARMQGLDKSLAERQAGQAFLNSIDQQTGKPNQALLMQNLKGDPSTAYAAQQAAQRGQTLDAETYKLHSDRLGALHSAAAQLIADNPNGVPQDAINRVIQNQVTLGNIQPQEAQAVAATFGADPRRNTQTLLQGLGRNISAQTALEASRPPTGQYDTGGGYQGFQRQSPMSSAPPTGAITPQGPQIPRAMTPAELNETVNMPDPRKTLPDGSPNPDYGRQKPFTRREQLEMTGNTVLPDGRVIPPGGQQGAPGSLGTGRYNVPGALRGPNAQTPGATPATGATTPPQRPISTLSEGEQGQIKESGPLFQRDANAATDAQTQHAMLGNMLADTAQFVPGPGAAGAGQFKSSMVTWAPGVARAFGIDPANIAAQQSFDKLAAQIADAQSKAGSDSRLAIVQAATPHSGLTKEGVDLILRQLQGNADFIIAKSKLADAYPNRSDYSGFQRTIRELDPRVFQYDRMTPEQKGTWISALDDRAYKAFQKSHKWHEDKGLIGAD